MKKKIECGGGGGSLLWCSLTRRRGIVMIVSEMSTPYFLFNKNKHTPRGH